MKTSFFPAGLKKPSIIPGFGVTLGFTLAYLLLVVLIPLSGLFFKTAELSAPEIWRIVTAPDVMHAYKISFGISLIAAIINAVFGLILAWILARYRFPLKKAVDAVIDLPFALPTAVAGVALAFLYGPNGWIGQYFSKDGWIGHAYDPEKGFPIANTSMGIAIALVFVGLPFVVRTVEPVLQDMEKELEEAALSLGATRWQTFWQIILPTILPALLTGFAMAFARGLGEYGSVIFIAGNIPHVSQIVPVLIVIKLEEYNYAGATAIASVMLIASFILLFIINWLQNWTGSHSVRRA